MINQIVLSKLNKEQKLEYEDINGFYKFYYECPACKRIYGTDEKEIHLFCPKCISEIKRKTRKGLNS
jgi:rRNA maturation endonuclease Nob1